MWNSCKRAFQGSQNDYMEAMVDLETGILENNNIDYDEIEYDLGGEFKSAVDAGKKSHVNLDIMYKTIATISKDNDIIIYLLRSYDTIDMKKAAKVAKVKSISILPTEKQEFLV